jgi:phospholipase/carboxylesterase/glyoxalase family protein
VIHEGQPVARRGPEPEAARAVVILLHGRGRDPEDVLSLADRIGDPEVAFLAPAARGNTWYPQSFLAPLAENEPYLSSALGVVDALVHGVEAERLVLGGFSQGACLAAEYALRHPRRYGGLLLYTGGAIGPPGTTWPPRGSFAGTPAYLGTADPDDWVPVERVRETAEALRAQDAEVTLEVFAGMDHLVNDQEIAAGRELIRGCG